MRVLFFSLAVCIAVAASADVVIFHIAPGTQGKAWNTKKEAIMARMGDVIRFYNDDSVPHQLHTNGAPCEHGVQFAPGETWDCIVASSYSAASDGALYDHHYGSNAKVWIEILE